MYEAQAELCRVFTHPTRIAVLELLSEGERSVRELAEASGVSQPTLSQHLAILRSRGVVETRREGTSVYYRLTDERIVEACHLMRSVLADQYRRLGSQVEPAAGRRTRRSR
jgi:ArsR family transcriptional regulator